MATRTRKPSNTIEKADITVLPPGQRPAFMLLGGQGRTTTAVSASRRERMEIWYGMYRQHPTVRAAIEKISKVATAYGYFFEPADPDGELDEGKERELRDFFRRSNGNQLLRATYRDLYIFGEAYWWLEPTRGRRPFRAQRLHPKYVDRTVENGRVVKYRYGPLREDVDAKEYEPKDIIAFRIEDPDSDLNGLSLLASLESTVASDLHAIEFNGNFFENAAQTGVVFVVKSSTSDEAKRNREWLEENYVGTKNAHRPLLLEGDVDVKQSVAKPQEMQFVEGRKLNRQDILSVLDVPPDKIGVHEDSNRSVSRESDWAFRSEAIRPVQTIVEEEINNSLVLGRFGWDDILFTHNVADSRSQLEQIELYDRAEKMGVMSPNQISRRLGLGKVEGGDVHFVQTAAGLIPVTLIDEVAARLLNPTAQQAVSPTIEEPEEPEEVEDTDGDSE